MCFGGGVDLENDYAERVGSYAFLMLMLFAIASLSEISYHTFNRIEKNSH